MAESILWATLIIAASSLIFAFIAFRQVMRTSGEVHAFTDRAGRFLDRFEARAKGIFTPDFMAETITKTVTKGLKNPDGTPVSMPQYIHGYAQTYGPGIYQDLKKEIPNYIPLLLASDPSPKGPQNRQPNGQWGSGGLTAASNLAKATKKVPMAGKIGEAIETGQALIGLVKPARDLIAEVKGFRGGDGDNGGESAVPSSGPGGFELGDPL